MLQVFPLHNQHIFSQFLYCTLLNILMTIFLQCQQEPYAFLVVNDSLNFHLCLLKSHSEEERMEGEWKYFF